MTEKHDVSVVRSLVCKTLGHKWNSEGIADYKCGRCGSQVPAWKVNVGLA